MASVPESRARGPSGYRARESAARGPSGYRARDDGAGPEQQGQQLLQSTVGRVKVLQSEYHQIMDQLNMYVNQVTRERDAVDMDAAGPWTDLCDQKKQQQKGFGKI